MSDTLSCASARQWVQRQLDDELTTADAPRLATHLAHCVACTQHASELPELSTLLGEVGESLRPDFPALPATLDTATLETDPRSLHEAPVCVHTPMWTRLSGGLAAAALVAVGLLLLTGLRVREQPQADIESVATLEVDRASHGSAVAVSVPSQHRSVHIFLV